MDAVDYFFDALILWVIYRMRDTRKTKTIDTKKADVLNSAPYPGMEGRKIIERAINELYQLGKIIILEGENADDDMIRIVDEKWIAEFRREELLGEAEITWR